MKHFIYLLAFAFMHVPGSAQLVETSRKENEVINLQVHEQENTLVINWESEIKHEDGYWEVQGSADGKEFSAIGFVMGSDPSAKNNMFRYKQSLSKIKPGTKFFRVVHILNPERATASTVVKLNNE